MFRLDFYVLIGRNLSDKISTERPPYRNIYCLLG